MALLRALNTAGLERFRAYLAQVRGGSAAEPPRALLDDAACTAELPVGIEIQPQRFATRFALGRYLCETIEPLQPYEGAGSVGLWAWLSLFFFDEVCPLRQDGARRPGQDYRHVPDFSFRYRYRHLLYGPYQIYRRHGGYSILLLSGPPDSQSAIYQEITSRQDLIANRGVVEATVELYMDRKRGGPKHGCQDAKAPPGSVRRFVRVLQQLDVNYDIYGMSGKDIVSLLPPEFDPWLQRGQTALPM